MLMPPWALGALRFKSAAFPAKHFDPLKSPYSGTQKHNEVKRRCNGLPLKCDLGCFFPYVLIYVAFYVCKPMKYMLGIVSYCIILRGKFLCVSLCGYKYIQNVLPFIK